MEAYAGQQQVEAGAEHLAVVVSLELVGDLAGEWLDAEGGAADVMPETFAQLDELLIELAQQQRGVPS